MPGNIPTDGYGLDPALLPNVPTDGYGQGVAVLAGGSVGAPAVDEILVGVVDAATILEIDEVLAPILEELATLTELAGIPTATDALGAASTVIESPNLLDAQVTLTDLNAAPQVTAATEGETAAQEQLDGSDGNVDAVGSVNSTTDAASLNGELTIKDPGD